MLIQPAIEVDEAFAHPIAHFFHQLVKPLSIRVNSGTQDSLRNLEEHAGATNRNAVSEIN